MNVLRRIPLAFVACVVIALCAIVSFYGCGPGAAQSALSMQASVIVANRDARVEFYEAAHSRCIENPAGLEAYRACMAPARHLARAADSYRESLHAAQAALDASGAEGAAGSIACAIESARRLVAALESANVPIPAEVSQIAAFVPDGVCNGSR